MPIPATTLSGPNTTPHFETPALLNCTAPDAVLASTSSYSARQYGSVIVQSSAVTSWLAPPAPMAMDPRLTANNPPQRHAAAAAGGAGVAAAAVTGAEGAAVAVAVAPAHKPAAAAVPQPSISGSVLMLGGGPQTSYDVSAGGGMREDSRPASRYPTSPDRSDKNARPPHRSNNPGISPRASGGPDRSQGTRDCKDMGYRNSDGGRGRSSSRDRVEHRSRDSDRNSSRGGSRSKAGGWEGDGNKGWAGNRDGDKNKTGGRDRGNYGDYDRDRSYRRDGDRGGKLEGEQYQDGGEDREHGRDNDRHRSRSGDWDTDRGRDRRAAEPRDDSSFGQGTSAQELRGQPQVSNYTLKTPIHAQQATILLAHKITCRRPMLGRESVLACHYAIAWTSITAECGEFEATCHGPSTLIITCLKFWYHESNKNHTDRYYVEHVTPPSPTQTSKSGCSILLQTGIHEFSTPACIQLVCVACTEACAEKCVQLN